MRYFPGLVSGIYQNKMIIIIKIKVHQCCYLKSCTRFLFIWESNVTELYSNIETLIDVPLLILRKIEYLQFTEINNSNK